MSWQDRLRQERAELALRLEALIEFMKGDQVFQIPGPDQVLLLDQSVHMAKYLKVLDERVERL